MLRFVPPFRGRYIASTRGGVTDNIARISISMLAACAGTVAHEGSATVSTSIGVSASGQQTDQQHFGTATVGVVISSTASASVTSTHSGTATASIVITTTAAGETGATHAGTAGIGITISASSSGTVVSPVEGVASCQVNLSVSAAGFGFDPSNQVPDESGNGNTMTLVSSPSSSTTPSFSTDAAIGSKSVDFDKSSDHGATVPSTYEDVLNSPFTFSAWLKPDDGQTTAMNYIFHSSGEFKRTSGTSPEQWAFQVRMQNSGDIVARIEYWSGTASSYRGRQTVNPVFSDGAQSSWTHLAVTVDSTCTPAIYINGSSVTVSNNGNDTLSLSDFFSEDSFGSIGCFGSFNGFGEYVPAFEWDGKLDDISIWSTSLTSTQISNLYNSGNGTDLTGSSNLAAWWKMGDSNTVTNSGTANISVTISATASGTASQTHTGTASCQVNLSASAAGLIFDPLTEVPDESGNGNNMTLYGDSSFSTDSAVGTKAVTFDGNGDYGVIDDNFQSVFQSPFSISVWVKPDDGQPTARNTIYSTGDTSSNPDDHIELWLGTNAGVDGVLNIIHNQQASSGYDSQNYRTTGSVFSDGSQSSYTHVVVTSNSSATPTVYINGSSVSLTAVVNESVSLSNYAGTGNLQIAKGVSSVTLFQGKVDDVSIWSTQLTSTQVSNLYNSGSGTDLSGSSNLEGWWKMGDSNNVAITRSGVASCQVNLSASAAGFNVNTIVPDETSNGNNMTLYNSPSFTSDAAVGTRATDFTRASNAASNAGVINSDFESVFQSSFSISLWLKPDDGMPDTTLSRTGIFSTYKNPTSGVESWEIESSLDTAGKVRFRIKEYFRDGGTLSYTTTKTTTNAVFSNGSQSTYKHLVYTYNSSGPDKLYVNGSSVSLTTDSGNIAALSNYTNSGDLQIGAFGVQEFSSGVNITNGWDGKIDDLSIWSKALSSTEVSNLYNSGSGSSLTGSSDLEGWWKMGDHSVLPVTHTGTATVSVAVTASASGETFTTHSGTASCQVNLSASASGTVIAGGFTISTFNTEANILASTPSDGTIAYGTDTESYYVYDSSLGWAEFIPS